ncbi:hypothetical protein KJS94_08970 [Flavihumibacter rivuli]|uniref:hypothetical protein n=1 Tax=Flavihumibacter rivuli TaxID=2838156 RepID=UPI001BDF3785|nr:hypothetical protein [Flavihumibacter rivuli]ULQ58325.1 hypothetical protein KJS94_08970 [Flavihumibacter rivuli]
MWVSKFIISSEVPLQLGVYEFSDVRVEIKELPVNDILVFDRSTLRYCELYIDESFDNNIEEVFLYLSDLCWKFLSRVSLVSYAKAELVLHIVTSKNEVPNGHDFLILSNFHSHFRNYKIPVGPNDLLGFGTLNDEREYLDVIINMFARAINSVSWEEKVMLFSSILERISMEEGDEFVEKVCNNCGVSSKSKMKATKRISKRLLNEKGVSNSDINLFLESNRNRIAHGGGKRDLKFLEDLVKSVSSIQHVIAELLIDRFNVRMVNSQTSFVGKPWVIYRFKHDSSGEIVLADGEYFTFKANALISKVASGDDLAHSNIEVCVGISTGSDNFFLSNKSFQKAFFPVIKT